MISGVNIAPTMSILIVNGVSRQYRHSAVPSKSSGSESLLRPLGDADAWRLAQRLKYDAVALGELHERGQLLGCGRRIEVERQSDLLESDRHILADAERASEIEITLGD